MIRNVRKVISFAIIFAIILAMITAPVPISAETKAIAKVSLTSGAIVDDLDDYSKMYDYSKDFSSDNGDPGVFENDKMRLTQYPSGNEMYILYKSGDMDITSVVINCYMYLWAEDVNSYDLSAYASADGVNYERLDLSKNITPNGDFPLYVYDTYVFPSGSRYVKIVLPKRANADESWGTQLSRVIINYNCAPVTFEPGPQKITGDTAVKLSTIEEGAEIYYHTSREPDIRLYTEPLKITSSTIVYAYAKKKGKLDSYSTSASYSSDADEKVDKYGQIKAVDYPGKITGDEQLKSDVAIDEAYYGSLKPPETDKFGGLPGSKEKLGLEATGYFHVQKTEDNKSVLVDPLGNVFFSVGTNCTGSPSYTYVKGREYIYNWLPATEEEKKEFNTAYLNTGEDTGNVTDNFSFYIANRIRKTGEAYNEEKFYKTSVERLKKWGFNTAGAFTENDMAKGLDYSAVHQLGVVGGSIDGINIPDVFSENCEKETEESFADYLPKHADEDYVIGYFIDNEYDFHKIKNFIPATKASEVASKKRLVDMLKEKYKDISSFNAAWEMSFKNFGELYEAELKVNNEAASADMDDFIAIYLEKYYKMVSTLFRKYDKNHLLMGDRWFNAVIRDEVLRGILCKMAGKYLDVISMNYYTYNIDLDMLKTMYKESGGVPFMFTEFHYGDMGEGLGAGIIPVDTEQQRGQAYRNYVEQAAASGYVVGTHWFQNLDQASTGRWFEGYDGENYAVGLINGVDRPYKVLLEFVMKTNYAIYDLVLGKQKPYINPVREDRVADKTYRITKSSSPIKVDGIIDEKVWAQCQPGIIDTKDRAMGIGHTDMSADMRLAWDKNCLYIAANIKDPTPRINNNPDHSVWDGDAVELFFGPEKVEQAGRMRIKDKQLVLSGGTLVQGGKFPYFWFNTTEKALVDMAVTMNADKKGYSIEAAIQWKDINVDDPAIGRMMRFDMGFDNSDGQNRNAQWFWNGVDGNAQSREKWGKAVLVDQSLPADKDMVTRVEAIFDIIDAIKLKSVKYNNHFKDVTDKSWYADSIQASVDAGIISGDSGAFKPVRKITKQELAAVLVRAYEKATGRSAALGDLSKFNDKDEIKAWAARYLRAGVGLGLITGDTETRLVPTAYIDAPQFEKIMLRFKELIKD